MPHGLRSSRVLVAAGIVALCQFAVSSRVVAQTLPRTAPSATFTPFEIRTFAGQQRVGELGKIVVAEGRDTPTSRTLPLAFVRLRSTSATPRDPIVFLMG